MHRSARRRWAVLIACLLGPSLAAADERVSWRTDAERAWRATRQQDKPLLVLVTSDACRHCEKLKTGTLADPRVAHTINERFVPLALDRRQTSPLLKELAVTSFPAVFIISPQAVVLKRIDGYVTAEQLRAQLAAALPATPSPAGVARSR